MIDSIDLKWRFSSTGFSPFNPSLCTNFHQILAQNWRQKKTAYKTTLFQFTFHYWFQTGTSQKTPTLGLVSVWFYQISVRL